MAIRLRAWLWLGLLLCASCEVYDPKLTMNGGGQAGSGGSNGSAGQAGNGPAAGNDGGAGDGGQMCVAREETCNLINDDCDDETDEDTAAECEAVILHGVTECVELLGEARCVLRRCLEGWSNCDGDPTNGCEPYCMCHACDEGDGGIDGDGGVDADGGVLGSQL